jgi:cytidylate kinase
MIICIFGFSCVGKSSSATLLANVLCLPLRSCGSAVLAAAHSLGLDIKDLPDDGHRTVDAETVDWARKSGTCIVEGRFLDQVLFGVTEPIFSIQLMANADVRLRRACGRAGHAITMEDLERIDRADREFRSRIYDGRNVIAPSLSVDTSESTVEECVNQIKTVTSGLIRPRT